MAYLIGQILLCLFAAALLGFLLGWWLMGSRLSGRIDGLQNTWNTDLATRDQTITKLNGRYDKLEPRLATMATDLESGLGSVAGLRDELATHVSGLAAVRDLNQEFSSRLGLQADTVEALKKRADGADSGLEELRSDLHGTAEKIQAVNKASGQHGQRIETLEKVKDTVTKLDGRVGNMGKHLTSLSHVQSTLDEHEKRIAGVVGWKSTLDDHEQRISGAAGLKSTLDDHEKRIAGLAGLQSTLDDHRNRIAGLAGLHAKLDDHENRINGLAGLHSQLDEHHNRIEALQGQSGRFGQLDEQFAALDGRFGELDTRVGALADHNAVADLERRVEGLEPLRSSVPQVQVDCRQAHQDLSAQLAAVEKKLAEKPQPVKPALPDDLKLIKGIGQVLERKLNDLGYRTFQDIAGFTAEEIDRVSAQLDFQGRIEREDWVAQARELHRKTHGG